MVDEDEKYLDMSELLKYADENPDSVLEVTSTLLEEDKSFESHESIKSQRFVAYSSKAWRAIKSNNNKINDEIIDLIEKSLIEAKAADDVSEDKQNDYYGLDRLNFFAKVLEELKPGRIQELWGKTRLYYFGNRVSINEAVVLTDDEILEEFGNVFFTFPHIVKYALIINPSNHDYISVHLSGEEDGDSMGRIRIFRDGAVKVDKVFDFDEGKNTIEQDSITEDIITISEDNNLGTEVNIESNEVDRKRAATEYYNRGVFAANKGLFGKAVQEYEKALEYEPSIESKILITCNCATTLLLKVDAFKRPGNGSDLSDEEYKDFLKGLELYQQVISMYEGLDENYILKSYVPLKELYEQAKKNTKVFMCYAATKYDAKKGQLVLRDSKPSEEEIRSKRQTLESEIKDLKRNRTKKYNEAGVIAYAKYKNNDPNFTGVTDIRIKWYAILAIDSEINKINQEVGALNSREKKSGLLGQIGDLISKTAKQGKSKIDLYTIGNKKNNAITEFGEQLYIDRNNGTLTLEELSSIWQTIDEFKKEIEIKEKEISVLNK